MFHACLLTLLKYLQQLEWIITGGYKVKLITFDIFSNFEAFLMANRNYYLEKKIQSSSILISILFIIK